MNWPAQTNASNARSIERAELTSSVESGMPGSSMGELTARWLH